MDDFDEVLFMDDPNFAEKLMAAIGAKPGDAVRFITPQFEREDGIQPIANPADLFARLHMLSREALQQIGCRPWGEHGLWLFPYQWYAHIPDGMELRCIDGTTEAFKSGVTDNDMRFGVLAYGIVPDFETGSEATNG